MLGVVYLWRPSNYKFFRSPSRFVTKFLYKTKSSLKKENELFLKDGRHKSMTPSAWPKICNSILRGKNKLFQKSSKKTNRFNQIYAIKSLMNYKVCYFCCCFTDLAPYQFFSILLLFSGFFSLLALNEQIYMYVCAWERKMKDFFCSCRMLLMIKTHITWKEI